jgi:hypothetical protein
LQSPRLTFSVSLLCLTLTVDLTQIKSPLLISSQLNSFVSGHLGPHGAGALSGDGGWWMVDVELGRSACGG